MNMKMLIVAATLLSSITAFSSVMNLECGEIHKVKEKTKLVTPFKFPLNMVINLGRTNALKVKLKNSKFISRSSDGVQQIGGLKKRSVQKRAYSNYENYYKHLALLEDAIELRDISKRPVYVCFGKITGLERWHNVASVSTISSADALDELVRKYQ